MTLPSPVVVAVMPADETRGYVGKIVTRGDEVFAVGGTYGAPLFMSSRAGGELVPHPTPKTLGLRNVLLDDTSVIIVGEYGLVASTNTLGERWRKIASHTDACLYAIVRDAERRLWISGDAGLVLRSAGRGGALNEVKTHLSGRMLSLYIDPGESKPWVLGTGGELARWSGRKFVVVPLPAMKTKQSLNEMMRLPTKTLVIAANGGAIMRSRDDGATWTKSPTHVRTMIEGITATRYGVLAVGEKATLLVSYDDARSFTPVETTMEGHLWTVTPAGDGVLIGGDMGRIYRITNAQLARMMAVAFTGHDDRLAALAHEVEAGADGAEMVLEDALRERGLW